MRQSCSQSCNRHCYRSMLHWLLKDEKRAIEDGRKAVELAPESSEAHARLGLSLMLSLNFKYTFEQLCP